MPSCWPCLPNWRKRCKAVQRRGSPTRATGLLAYPAAAWHRALFKAPLLLWRLGFGPWLGHALLVLTYTGRRSGLPRRAVIEYRELGERKYVICAFGQRADWLRSIQADPCVTIQTADGAEAALARRVTDDEELLAVYALLQQRIPFLLERYLRARGVPNTPEGVLQHRDRIDIVAFEPTDAPAPPPLAADLIWVWGMAAVIAGLRWLRRRRPA